MSELTQCPICFERFNITDKDLKILSCGHTFCKECLFKQKEKENIFKCSICRRIQNFDNPEEITSNRTIYDLLYNPKQENDDNNDNSLQSLDNSEKPIVFKFIVIGPPSAGKSCLVARYIDKAFSDKYSMTVGFDFKVKKFKYNNKKVHLEIFDTAGTENYQSIARNYYRGSFGALVVFDVCNKTFFENLDFWIDCYRENRDESKEELIYLVGNKIDKEKEEREVSKEEIKDFMKNHKIMNYFECSAKTGENVDNIFQNIINDLARFYLINNKYKKYVKNIVLDKSQNNRKCCC
jgi:small GTP-binding protein